MMNEAKIAHVDRHIHELVSYHIEVFRVVVLNGPRQSGKTTLLKDLQERLGGSFRNLDREDALTAARFDPRGFAAAGAEPRFIDEVQRAGDSLVREIKAEVDDDPRPGRYVLAGSTRFLTAPIISESLAGRAAILDVWPLSQGEMRGRREGFVDVLFGEPEAVRALSPEAVDRLGYLQTICVGGFPDVVRMPARARTAWFRNYVATITDRDIREMARVNEPSAAVLVLRALAASTATELVIGSLAEKTNLGRSTVARYVGLLEAVFMAHEIPIWSRNLSKRMVKSPKTHLVDSGLAAHLLRITPEKLAQPQAPGLGQLTETFVVNEIAKQVSWAESEISMSHYRDRNGPEVDLVLEDQNGLIAGIEVKAASTVRPDDAKHLFFLRDLLGSAFGHGVVLYLGDQVLPLGDRVTGLPLSAVWAPANG